MVLTDDSNPIAVELAAGFVREWPTGEGSAVEQAAYQADADLPERSVRAAAAKPDVVLIAASVPDFRQAAGQLSGALSAPLLYGGEDVGVGPLAAGGGNLVTATVATMEDFTDRGKEFVKRYQERFHEPPGLPACQAYDAARVLFDAMGQAKGVAPDHVRDQLAAASDFDGLTGPLRFKDGRARRRVFMVGLHDGVAKTVQTIDPEPDAPAVAQ